MNTVIKLKYWLFQPVDRMVLQVPRALAASVLSAFLDCVCMIVLVEVGRWQPLPAAVFSYLVGGMLQYVLCSVWVFPDSPGNKVVSLLTFIVLSLGGLGITWGVMAVGTRMLLPYGMSKVLALGLSFVWNFTSRKLLLFRKKAAPAAGDLGAPGFDTPDYKQWMAAMAEAATIRPSAAGLQSEAI